MTGPWDKHLGDEVVDRFVAHRLVFEVTTNTERAAGPGYGDAVFSRGELKALKSAARGGKIPKELSQGLHAIKRILGGEVTKCVIDVGQETR